MFGKKDTCLFFALHSPISTKKETLTNAVYSPITNTDIKYLVSLNCNNYCMYFCTFCFLAIEFENLVKSLPVRAQWFNVSYGYPHATQGKITRTSHFVNKASVQIIIELTLFHGGNGGHILQGHGRPQRGSRGLCYSLEVGPTSYEEAEKERDIKRYFFNSKFS